MIRVSVKIEIKGVSYGGGICFPNLDNRNASRTIQIKDFLKYVDRNLHFLIFKNIDGEDKDKSEREARRISFLKKEDFYVGQGYEKKHSKI